MNVRVGRTQKQKRKNEMPIRHNGLSFRISRYYNEISRSPKQKSRHLRNLVGLILRWNETQRIYLPPGH